MANCAALTFGRSANYYALVMARVKSVRYSKRGGYSNTTTDVGTSGQPRLYEGFC
jgi:hypothetical protein